MNITFIIPSLGPGGAERVLLEVARHLSSKKYKVCIITLRKAQIIYDLTDIKLINLDVATRGFKLIPILRKALLETKPDLVISFLSDLNIMTLLALVFSGIRVIISERSNPKAEQKRLAFKLRLLQKFIYRLAAKVVCQSQRAKDHYIKTFHVKKQYIEVIPNPISTQNHTADEASLIKHPRPCISCLGRLTKEKGTDLLLNSFAEISKENPEWTLVICGDGPERQNLETQAKELQINTRVIFKGLIKDVHTVLSATDIFVLPSRWEGFPNALLEAMNAGCACIAYDCEFGPREIIEDEKTGILVQAQNTDMLAMAIKQLIQNEKKRTELGTNAKLSVGKQFNREKILAHWEEIINETNQN